MCELVVYQVTASASLRIRLVLGPCLIECSKLQAGGIGRYDLWEFVERDFKPASVCNLWDQAHIGERDGDTVRVGAGAEHSFQRAKSLEDPMMIPGVDLCLLMLELPLEILKGNQIVQRMDVAGDRLRDGSYLGAADGIWRQQRRLRCISSRYSMIAID